MEYSIFQNIFTEQFLSKNSKFQNGFCVPNKRRPDSFYFFKSYNVIKFIKSNNTYFYIL